MLKKDSVNELEVADCSNNFNHELFSFTKLLLVCIAVKAAIF